MKIVCPSCSAAYRFEAAKVPDGGKKVQCSRCSHVFTVRRPNDPSGDPTESDQSAAQGSSGDSSGDSGEVKRLIVRQDGTRYKVRDLPTLQRWIVERRLTREAEISFDGESWEKVGERGDLIPYFEMVDREAQRSFSPAGLTQDSTRVSIKPRIEGVRVMTTLRPGDDDDDDDDDEYEYYDDDEYEDDFEELDEDYLDDEEDLADFVEADDAPAGGVFSFPDLEDVDDDDEEVVSWQGAPLAPSPSEGTPIFNKAALVSDDDSGEPIELEVAEEPKAPITPKPVTPPQPPKAEVQEEEDDKGAPIIPIALVAILLCGVVYFLFFRTPPGPGPIAKNPDVSTPVKVKPKPTPTATAKATPTATPKPTPTATPKPTPTPKPKPRVTPKPRPRATPRPQAPAPSTSPAVLADRAYRQGKALQNKGDFTGAVEQFKLANRHRPRALHYEELGFTSLEIHDSSQKASALTQAESSFREALKLEKRADAWLGLGVTFRRQGKTQDAIQAFEACLRARPSEDTAGEAEWFLKQLKAGNP